MVSNLKVLKAKVDEFCSGLHEICVIHCKLKSKRNLELLRVVLGDGESKNVYDQSHVLFGQWTGTFCRKASLTFPENGVRG